MGFQYDYRAVRKTVLWVSHTTVVFGLGSRNREPSVMTLGPAGCPAEVIRRASKRSQICADSPRICADESGTTRWGIHPIDHRGVL
jgi:hypothetical protein